MKQAFFITGTDTDVGKTFVACELMRQFIGQGFKVVGMKPVAAGREFIEGKWVHGDVQKLIAAGNVDAPLEYINPFSFDEAIAPHIAAEKAGIQIRTEVVLYAFQQLCELADVVIVEGAGGFLVPLNENETLADLAVILNIPVILVTSIKLGCINHALLTVEAIKKRNLCFHGWVANCLNPSMSEAKENINTLSARLQNTPLLTYTAHVD
jgi:dethiobiotin synthetase